MRRDRKPMSFIATDDPDASRRFYQEVLGLSLQAATPFALVFADGGHVLRLQIVPEVRPLPYTVYGWQVEDIAAEMDHLLSKGVAFQRFDGLQQDDLGVWTTPDGARVAWFADPSGNTLSLTQNRP